MNPKIRLTIETVGDCDVLQSFEFAFDNILKQQAEDEIPLQSMLDRANAQAAAYRLALWAFLEECKLRQPPDPPQPQHSKGYSHLMDTAQDMVQVLQKVQRQFLLVDDADGWNQTMDDVDAILAKAEQSLKEPKA